MRSQRRLLAATAIAFVLGAGLMIPFESAPARIAGVAALFAFIVLGVFAIASPRFLAADDRTDDGDVAGDRSGDDHRSDPTP